MIYELKVFDDGECAVKKTEKELVLPINTILKSRDELVKYLTEVISLRWPIEDVLERIEAGRVEEWVEFK